MTRLSAKRKTCMLEMIRIQCVKPWCAQLAVHLYEVSASSISKYVHVLHWHWLQPLIGPQGVASNNGAFCIFWWPDIIDNARLVLKVALAKQLQSLRTSRAALAAAHEAAQHSWAAASIFSRKGHLPWQFGNSVLAGQNSSGISAITQWK